MGVVDPGCSFYDMRKGRSLSLDAFAHGLYSVAKRRMGMMLNKGYDPSAESIRDVSAAIRESDQVRHAISEMKDAGEQAHDVARIQTAHKNEAFFEDDVLAYLLIQTRNQFITHLPTPSLLPEQGTYARAQQLSRAADRAVLDMAFGVREVTDQVKGKTRGWYGEAASLEDEFYGRGNAQSQVHHKLHDRFDRYFGLTLEAAEVAFQGVPLDKTPQGIILSRTAQLDNLLEQLHAASTKAEREAIIAKLKEL